MAIASAFAVRAGLEVLAVSATLFLTNLATLLLLDGITGNFTYPVMSAAQYISYAGFLENIGSLVMMIWMGGTFIKVGSSTMSLS